LTLREDGVYREIREEDPIFYDEEEEYEEANETIEVKDVEEDQLVSQTLTHL